MSVSPSVSLSVSLPLTVVRFFSVFLHICHSLSSRLILTDGGPGRQGAWLSMHAYTSRLSGGYLVFMVDSWLSGPISCASAASYMRTCRACRPIEYDQTPPIPVYTNEHKNY